VPADSVSWRICKNPVTLFIGGVTAVLLEFAEPRIRTGVWEHTTFRSNPVRRLRRTGLAAMITVYGARSTAEAMIAGVRRMHDAVRGTTTTGLVYYANDPDLLRWVHATAAFGFLEAYQAYVRPLTTAERDRYFAEGVPASRLYGVEDAPSSEAELRALFEATTGRLERSDVVFEFLAVMRRAEILPAALRPVQDLVLRAAIDVTPRAVRSVLGLDEGHGLRSWERPIVRLMARTADRLMLTSSPAVQACLRLDLPADYLFARGRT
jgi:uncharacterized protein (DUF2236 family)